jgi:hypothetical protein
VSLATIQSQLSAVFLSSIIPQTRVSYVGGLLDSLRTNYPANFTSSYLATLSSDLTLNLAEGFYIARAQANSVGPTS